MAFANIVGAFGMWERERAGVVQRMLNALPDPHRNPLAALSIEHAEVGARSVLRGAVERPPYWLAKTPGPEEALLALDGSLDNLYEIAKELLVDDSGGVAEVLLRAYANVGDRLWSKLRGDFAVVVYQSKKRRLVLARDAVGTRPLYWGSNQGANVAVFVASLPRGVLAGQGCRVTARADAVWREAAGLTTLAPESFHDSVQAVPPGCYVAIEDAKAVLHRYFVIPKLYDETTAVEDIAQDYSACFQREVRARAARTRGKLGILLSGGLDSSAVLGSLAQERDQSVLAFTGVASGLAVEDLPYAEMVANHCHASWFPIAAKPERTPDEILVHASNPYRASRTWFALPQFRAAIDAGCQILFSGATGDFSGGGSYSWTEFRRDQGRAKMIRELAACSRATLVAKARRFLRSEWDVFATDHVPSRYRAYLLPRRWLETQRLLALLRAPADCKRRLGAERMAAIGFAIDPQVGLREQAMWLLERGTEGELSSFDFLGRATGIELAHPLSAKDLYVIAANLPWALRRRGHVTRLAIRQAVGALLPNRVSQRTQKVTITQHVRDFWADAVENVESTELVRVAGMIDLVNWNRAVARFSEQTVSVARSLYQTTVLARWSLLNDKADWGN